MEINENRKLYVGNGEFFIYPLDEQDREEYLELCKLMNGEIPISSVQLYEDAMWNGAMRGEAKIYSVFDANHEYCGSIEWKNCASDTPELGIDLKKSKTKVLRLS